MSSRRSVVEEFESVFKAAVRPGISIEPLALQRLLVVLDVDGCPGKLQALTDCAVSMAARYQLEVLMIVPLIPGRADESPRRERAHRLLADVARRMGQLGVTRLTQQLLCVPPHTAILEAVASFSPSMVVMSTLFGENVEDLEHFTLGATADRVLSSLREPILLIEGEIDSLDRVWSDMLVLLESTERSSPCLGAVRALAQEGSRLHLLHVIDQMWLERLQQALEMAATVPGEHTEQALLRSLRGRMERYLDVATEELTAVGYQVSREILVADPVECVRDQIEKLRPGLLVCNSVAPDRKLIDSVAYNLAAYVREVPLLLC